jgi:hypothetical protein
MDPEDQRQQNQPGAIDRVNSLINSMQNAKDILDKVKGVQTAGEAAQGLGAGGTALTGAGGTALTGAGGTALTGVGGGAAAGGTAAAATPVGWVALAIVAVLVILVFVIVFCGGDKRYAKETKTTAPTSTPTPTASTALPSCNTNGHCDTCTGAISNTCFTNNGTCNYIYDQLFGGGSCATNSTPGTVCTYDNCDATSSCVSNSCVPI